MSKISVKEPSWTSREGDTRFWKARGVVQSFLSELYRHSLAPIRDKTSIPIGYRKSRREEHFYLFVPNQQKLKELAQQYGNNREFFKVLESIYISELIYKVRIKVKMKNSGDYITFEELSEGEQQLLTVLGLMRFIQDEESLFLLDEPDTHLNPAWKLKYMNLLEQVAGPPATSHVIICTHDPLVIGGLLKEQVQIFEKESQTGKIITNIPEIDPRGMGVAGLLTSELFGLSTTVDLETQKKLDRKRELFLKDERTEDEQEEMRKLADELGTLDYTRTIRDPLYDKFVRALMSREEFKKPILTPEERRKQEEIAKEILDEILAEEN
ncbi:AAA family ATPase [Candidatus Poribacteria bacterium]|nr:AAA family ATPase [Candidatus Poribacteria bacterium]